MSHVPNKIRLRLTIPTDEHANDDVMSMSMSADDGPDGAADTNMLSPPSSTTSSFKRTPASGVATPTSTRNHKRPRTSNDWVEDEVHPSLVGHGFGIGGGEGKRVMTTALAALSAQLSGDSGSLGHDDGGTYHRRTNISGDTHNLMMMPASSSPSPPFTTLRRALSSTAPTMQFELENHHHGQAAASFMSPSSPSDPSPLIDLRKTALLRSRFMKDDTTSGVMLHGTHSTGISISRKPTSSSTARREEDVEHDSNCDGERRRTPTSGDGSSGG